MKVKDLISRLKDFDPDAEVRLMTQENWPFENRIVGLTERYEFDSESDEGCSPDDVFIVEGEQLCYGSKDAWEHAV